MKKLLFDASQRLPIPASDQSPHKHLDRSSRLVLVLFTAIVALLMVIIFMQFVPSLPDLVSSKYSYSLTVAPTGQFWVTPRPSATMKGKSVAASASSVVNEPNDYSNAVNQQGGFFNADVHPNEYAFAALKDDGTVVTWGNETAGGSSAEVKQELHGVADIYGTMEAFAALRRDGSVVNWGDAASGGDSSAVAPQLSNGVRKVYSTRRAFAALKEDGSVVAWGDPASGGDSSAVALDLASAVTTIASTDSAFAALKRDGSVATWGSISSGGDSSAVVSNLSSGVTTIYATYGAFAALRTMGRLLPGGIGETVGMSWRLMPERITVSQKSTPRARFRRPQGRRFGRDLGKRWLGREQFCSCSATEQWRGCNLFKHGRIRSAQKRWLSCDLGRAKKPVVTAVRLLLD